jgi:hypothetical protein
MVSAVRSWWFRMAKATQQAAQRGFQFRTLVRTDRIVVHAWK